MSEERKAKETERKRKWRIENADQMKEIKTAYNKKRYKEDPDRDPEILASKLIQHFQNYSIDIPNHKRYEYAIFSSLQHLNLIVNRKMEREDIDC